MSGIQCGKFDTSKLPPDQSVVTEQKIWLKADIDEKIFQIPNNVRPHVLFKLTAPCGVTLCGGAINGARGIVSALYAIQSIANAGNIGNNPKPAQPATANNDIVKSAQSTIDSLNVNDYGNIFRAVMPSAGVVAMRSNVRTYGPWVSSNADTSSGGMSVDVNPDLNPWTYGSFSGMNSIASSLVENSNIGLVKAESGSITIPGLPDLVNLGTAINDTGPNLSAISFVYGSQGLTTTYEFQTFNPKLGGLGKSFVDQLKTFSKKRREQIRFLRNLQNTQNKISRKITQNSSYNSGAPNLAAVPAAKKNSGIELFIGQMWDHQSNNSSISQRTVISAETSSKKENEMTFDYEKKAFMSLDGLLGPVSLKGSSGLPKFAIPLAASGSAPILPQPPFATGYCSVQTGDLITDQYNVNTQQKYLTPLTNNFNKDEHHHNGPGAGHVIDIVGRENAIPSNGIYTSHYGLNDPQRYSNDYRFLSLRGPLVLHSWGYDLDGKPIPNLTDNENATKQGVFTSNKLKDQFLADWLQKPATWPVAPIDLRFDRERGLWVSPQPYKIVVAKIIKKVTPNGEGFGVIINYGKPLVDAEGKIITASCDGSSSSSNSSSSSSSSSSRSLTVITNITLTSKGIVTQTATINITDFSGGGRSIIPVSNCTSSSSSSSNESWYCQNNKYCVNDNTETPSDIIYSSESECNDNCNQVWYCESNGQDDNGNPQYTCIKKTDHGEADQSQGEFSGPYYTETECNNSCNQAWYCESSGSDEDGNQQYSCIQKANHGAAEQGQAEFGGPYSTEDECLSGDCFANSSSGGANSNKSPIIKIIDRLGKTHQVGQIVYAYYDTSAQTYIVLQC